MPMGPRLPRRCPPYGTHYEKGAPYKTIGVEFGRRVRDLYVRELLTAAEGTIGRRSRLRWRLRRCRGRGPRLDDQRYRPGFLTVTYV